MHHQYAPLLARLREMILTGGSPLYSFEVGLGINFVSLFGYYLASPFNLLLVFFPEHLLAEGILVITLLKTRLPALSSPPACRASTAAGTSPSPWYP